MRIWISGPRILGGLIRPGISLGREDLHVRIPQWRRFEYMQALKRYAAEHGQPISDAQARHDVGRAVDMGELDAQGPVLRMKGSRDEIIAAVIETSSKYGVPMDGARAGQLVDKAIADPWPRRVLILILAAALIALIIATASH